MTLHRESQISCHIQSNQLQSQCNSSIFLYLLSGGYPADITDALAHIPFSIFLQFGTRCLHFYKEDDCQQVDDMGLHVRYIMWEIFAGMERL